MPEFAIKFVRLGPVTLSFVINKTIARYSTRPVGGFITWDKGWMASTLRVGYLYINLDADFR